MSKGKQQASPTPRQALEMEAYYRYRAIDDELRDLQTNRETLDPRDPDYVVKLDRIDTRRGKLLAEQEGLGPIALGEEYFSGLKAKGVFDDAPTSTPGAFSETAPKRLDDETNSRPDRAEKTWLFQQTPKGWRIGPEEQPIEIEKTLKGFKYIRLLILAGPGNPIDCMELQQSINIPVDPPSKEQNEDFKKSKLSITPGNRTIEVTEQEERTMKEYGARLQQIEEERPKPGLDDESLLKLEDEEDFIMNELKQFNRDGRTRDDTSTRERVRSAVWHNINYALEAIEKVNPDVAALLRTSISTGKTAMFTPTDGVRWEV